MCQLKFQHRLPGGWCKALEQLVILEAVMRARIALLVAGESAVRPMLNAMDDKSAGKTIVTNRMAQS